MLNPRRSTEDAEDAARLLRALLAVDALLLLFAEEPVLPVPPVAPPAMLEDPPVPDSLLDCVSSPEPESEDDWQASKNCMVQPPSHMPVSSQLGGVQ